MPKKSRRVMTFISMRFMNNEVPLSEMQRRWVPFQSIRAEDAAASVLERKMVLDPRRLQVPPHAEESEGSNRRGEGDSLIPHKIKALTISCPLEKKDTRKM